MFTVYVLYSPNHQKTYTGYTSSLDDRIKSHNALAKKGFTVKYRPWVILYTEQFETKTEALKREKELKSGKGRDFIKKLVLEKYST
jgi:putative endonuclease